MTQNISEPIIILNSAFIIISSIDLP